MCKLCWVFNALLVAAVAGTLAVAEIGLRIAGYDPLGSHSGGRHRFLRSSAIPDLEYELVPGARGFAWGRDMAINSHGFRDRKRALEKADGVELWSGDGAPSTRDTSGRDDALVGRVRSDPSRRNGVLLWVATDGLRLVAAEVVGLAETRLRLN